MLIVDGWNWFDPERRGRTYSAVTVSIKVLSSEFGTHKTVRPDPNLGLSKFSGKRLENVFKCPLLARQRSVAPKPEFGTRTLAQSHGFGVEGVGVRGPFVFDARPLSVMWLPG